MHQSHQPQRILSGFLESEGLNPAFDSRLLLIRAGDVEENPGPKVSPKRRCHCSKAIRSDATNFLQCSTAGCPVLSHASEKCSGIGRYRSKANWTCKDHSNSPTPPPPTAVSINNPEDTQREKRYCAKKGCGIVCKKGSYEFQCSVCKFFFHQGCTDMSRKVIEVTKQRGAPWTCNPCLDKANAVPPTIPDFEEDTTESCDKTKGKSKESLRIIQWNADCLRTKALELQDRLQSDDIDICIIQETKMNTSDKPSYQGYTCIRADRKHLKGGGLAILIRSTLVFEKLDAVSIDATETQSIKVRMGKNKWIYITNVYCPPDNSKGHDQIKLRLDSIPSFKSSLICGDVNGHTQLWDIHQPSDDRGEALLDWIMDKELTILNDGAHTRINKGTGNESTPDVSLCGTMWADKIEWSTGECIGASDHLPIYITVRSKTNHQSVFGKTPRWRSNGVDWKEFGEAIETTLQTTPLTGTLQERILQFTKTMTDTGFKLVGKVKPGRKTRIWLTPPVRASIRQRNSLRRKIKTHRKEWMEQCKITKEEIEKAKQEKWKEVVEEAIDSTDDNKIWKFIKSLSGSPDSAPTGEVMKHNGRVITSNKRKADIFSSHYAGVSNLKFNKEERTTNREAKRMLGSPSAGNIQCRRFTIQELNTAIKKMRGKGAPGGDDIPPQFIKALGPIARGILLDLFNESFEGVTIPQVWRNAIIIPLLKLGKPSSALSSYRPVSLTSCLIKTFERMIADRLYDLVESKNMLSHLQAGFRRNLSCEDQVLKMTQLIEDGFQRKRCNRSVLVLLDYSKAFDQVWRQKLLLSLADKGIPLEYVRWLNCFLSNRQARVRFADATSKMRLMKQGLPQGSVLSPLLFILFINNLAELLPPNALVAMFADDVTLLATHVDKREAEKEVQTLVDIVALWSKQWKLTLNAGKCEACFFSTDPKEANWSPSIIIDGRTIKHEPTPRLLGVTLDRTLCFATHTANVTKSAASKLKILAKLAYTDWGGNKFELFRIYQAIVKSKLDYAAPAWQPWLSDTQFNKLEVVQNRALRLITGQTKSTRVTALRLEANTESYKTLSDRNILTSYEKAARLPQNHPRNQLLEGAPPRNKRTSWRSRSKELASLLPVEALDRKPITLPSRSPWATQGHYEVRPSIPGISRKDDSSPAQLRSLTITILKELKSDLVIYTDGSASGGMLKGGAAVVVTRGDVEYPEVIHKITERGSPFTSSFEEEHQAMTLAVDWCNEYLAPAQNCLIATDSQSLCKALLGPSVEVHQLKTSLDQCIGNITIQWVPGHADIPGNELADAAAKEATTLEAEPRATTFNGIAPQIRANIKGKPIDHARTAEVYSNFSLSREQMIKTRKDQVMLARIRSGHSLLFREYKHRIGNTIAPHCIRCSDNQPDNLEHWLKCDGTLEARVRIYGFHKIELSDLTKWPRESVALARSTLLRGVEDC